MRPPESKKAASLRYAAQMLAAQMLCCPNAVLACCPGSHAARVACCPVACCRLLLAVLPGGCRLAAHMLFKSLQHIANMVRPAVVGPGNEGTARQVACGVRAPGRRTQTRRRGGQPTTCRAVRSPPAAPAGRRPRDVGVRRLSLPPPSPAGGRASAANGAAGGPSAAPPFARRPLRRSPAAPAPFARGAVCLPAARRPPPAARRPPPAARRPPPAARRPPPAARRPVAPFAGLPVAAFARPFAVRARWPGRQNHTQGGRNGPWAAETGVQG